jgi:hypothetical protein
VPHPLFADAIIPNARQEDPAATATLATDTIFPTP